MNPIAIVGGGPGGLTCAIALARRGIRTTVFDNQPHPATSRRFDPDRSYPIDITGHGLRAIRHIDAVADFDAQLTAFKGILYRNRVVDPWDEPGWIGSRGDITNALTDIIERDHSSLVDLRFDTEVTDLDVIAGTIAGEQFDLIIGADGANSRVRSAMSEQIPGFVVERSERSNFGLILELDLAGEQLDKHYLNALAVSPFTMSGVVNDETRPEGVRWTAVIGTKHTVDFESPHDAYRWLRRHVPRAVENASDQAIADLSRRRWVPLGRRVTCSSLAAGRAVLMGDAAVAIPPIGQGCNAALESAVVLDECLAAGPLESFGERYQAAWGPQTEALSRIGWQVQYQSPMTLARALLGAALGVNLAQLTKSSTLSYAQVLAKARRLGPLAP